MPANLFERFKISTARYTKGNYFARHLIAISSGFSQPASLLLSPLTALPLLFSFRSLHPPPNAFPAPPAYKREAVDGCVVAKVFFSTSPPTHTHKHILLPLNAERSGKIFELIRTKKSI